MSHKNSATCQICQCKESRIFYSQGPHNLIECSGCGFIWLSPLPSREEIRDIYNDAYEGATSSYFGKINKKMRRSRRRAKKFRKLVSEKNTPLFLDIGASGGFMTEAAREIGFKTTGLEIDPVSLQFARRNYPKNHFFEGSIESFIIKYPTITFDMVYCSEVIEHVTDVNSFVSSISRLLRQDGYLYVTTPNIRHWRRPRNLRQWDGYCPPSHCLYFDSQTLPHLLERFNIKVVRSYISLKPGIKILACKK